MKNRAILYIAFLALASLATISRLDIRWFDTALAADVATSNGGGLSSISLGSSLTGSDSGGGLCGNGTSSSPLNLCGSITGNVAFSGSPTFSAATLFGLSRTAGAGTITNSNTNTTTFNCSTTGTADCYTIQAPASGSGSSLTLNGIFNENGTTLSNAALTVNNQLFTISNNVTSNGQDFSINAGSNCTSGNTNYYIKIQHNSSADLEASCGGIVVIGLNGNVQIGSSSSFANLVMESTSAGKGEVVTGGASPCGSTTSCSGAVVVAGHVDQDAAGEFAGQCTFSGTSNTCTATLTNGYASSALCFVQPLEGQTYSGVSGQTFTVTNPTTGSTFTITSRVGGVLAHAAGIVNWMCIGNPN